jgi:hypothetical protein
MINNYTVTFEDGQYAVNLVGANSNIADVVNVNQVSVRSANSAGLQDLTSLRAASFNNGMVAVDFINGSSGIVYPTGTLKRPSNNIKDAVAIAKENGIDSLYIIGVVELKAGDDVTSFKLIGQNPINSILILNSAAVIDKADISECSIRGVLDDSCVIRSCMILDLSYVNGFILDSGLTHFPITLGENAMASFINCYSIVTAEGYTANIDFAGHDQDLIFRGYTGDVKIKNHTHDTTTALDFDSGWLTVDSTCTSGKIYVRGIVELDDNSTDGCTVYTYGKVTTGDEHTVVVDKLALLDGKVSSTFETESGNWKITGNQMLFYKEDGTELMRFNLFDKAGNPTETNVYERVRV